MRQRVQANPSLAPQAQRLLKTPAPCSFKSDRVVFRISLLDEESELNTCPANVVDLQEVTTWLSLYSMYKAGFLWREGGIRDQPAAYVHAMKIIDAAVNQIEREQLEESKKNISVPKGGFR